MLTDQQCAKMWNGASNNNRIIVDSKDGKQVMDWLGRKNEGLVSNGAPMGISRKAFISPIDGSRIRGAADLAAHEREHNVIQVGNEYVGIVNEKRAAAKEAKHERAKQMQQDAKHFSYH